MKTLEDYKSKGKEICEKYLEFKNQSPIMLPPAPKQTYIDVYIDEEGASSSTLIDDEKCKQANYEAEVLTYRALERLPEERCVVLHSFKYSHHQYRICDKSHDRRNCNLCKGNAADKTECDFVVIGKNYVAIIEVKNVPINEYGELTEEQRKELAGAFKGSLKQLERTKLLINGLVEQVFGGIEADQCSVICLSAFPNTSRDRFQDMEEQTKRQILGKEDFLYFSSWWKKNVLGSISNFVQTEAFLTKHQEIKQVLVAMYCTDKKLCDELKCSLAKAIMDIDDELKKGNITFLSKNRPPNPNVIKATDIVSANVNQDDIVNIFSDIIGVEYLTAEQHDAFNRDRNLLINGPVGSGKTIILLAKIIQVINSNVDNRAVLYIFSNDNISCERYQDTLYEAKINNEVIVVNPNNDSSENIAQKVLDSSYRVVILRMPLFRTIFSHTLTKLMESNLHVFIDDWQGISGPSGVEKLLYAEVLQLFRELSPTNCVWWAFDFTQSLFLYAAKDRFLSLTHIYSFIKDIPLENIVTFSLNLRNTSDITDILSKTRERIILQLSENKIEDYNKLFIPMIKQGHFVHGPKIVVHVINVYSQDHSEVIDILNTELNKLLNTDVTRSFKIGIVYNGSDNLITKFNEKQYSASDNNEIEWCNIYGCFSVEYPAVIVLYDLFGSLGLNNLYLQISRARVYCAVIVYHSYHSFSGDNLSQFNDMLVKLGDSVRVLRYT